MTEETTPQPTAAPMAAPAKKRRATEQRKETKDGGEAKGTKIEAVVSLMRRPGGATLAQLTKATGWQPHSVRGAISGTLRKRLGLAVTTKPDDAGRLIYRIAARR